MSELASKRSHGFTLVESIVTLVIVSITALALSSALSVAFSHSSDGLVHSRSTQLAQAYFEEILSQRYAEATPLGGVPPCVLAACGSLGSDSETRDQFDDVDDYDGVDDLPPRNALDQALTDYPGYRVQVSVSFATAAQIAAWSLDDATDAKVVTLQITPPAQSPRTFQAIRGNY